MAIRIYERTCIQEFTLGTVAADSTGGGPLDFESVAGQNIFNGILRNLSVSCDSTDYDISLRTKSNGQEDTIDEIYRAVDINKYRFDDDLHVGWVNSDPTNTSKLYAVITNNDLARATGAVRINLTMDINKKFSKYTG
jgi:two-component SAPR family response regulator